MVARAILVLLCVFLLSAAAEADNYGKFNSPSWGNRWKQILKNKPPHFPRFLAVKV